MMNFNDPVLVATSSVNTKLAEIVKAVTGSNLFQHCDKNRYTQAQRDLIYLSGKHDNIHELLSSVDPALSAYTMTFAVLVADKTYERLIEYGKIRVSRLPSTFDQVCLVKISGDLLAIKHFVIDGSSMDNSFIQIIALKMYDIVCVHGFRALWGDYLVTPKQNHLRIEAKKC